MTYKNLEMEMLTRNIKRRDLAYAANIPYTTFTDKIKGKRSFKLLEAVKVRNAIDKNMSLEYLFEESFKEADQFYIISLQN